MHIIAIDQGTTSTRAIVFDWHANPLARAQVELPQHYPQSGCRLRTSVRSASPTSAKTR